MDRFQTFQQFIASQAAQVPVWGFVLNLFLAAILSFILAVIYVTYGTSLSNRRMFARNFMLLTMTTMFIITVVKSSLALSLGLVGALSIVRFRAAIKEPEELAYLFFCISIGLGLGADQRIVTLIAFTAICGIIIIRKQYYRLEKAENLYLTVTSRTPQKVSLEQVVEILKKYCTAVDMKRFDETPDLLEGSFLIEFDTLRELNKAKSELQSLSSTVQITFLDNKGMPY